MLRLRDVQRHIIVRRQKRQMLAEYLLDLEQLFPSYPVCTGPVNVQALYTSADLIRQYAPTTWRRSARRLRSCAPWSSRGRHPTRSRLTALLRGSNWPGQNFGERHQMANDPLPFALAGAVVSWDPAARVLYIGSARLEVAAGVAVEALVPKQPSRSPATARSMTADRGW
jgi:hypothetical protein